MLGLGFVLVSAAPDAFAPAISLRVQRLTGASAAGAAQVDRSGESVSKLFGLLSACGGRLPELERWRIAGAIHDESTRFGYDPLFAMAMIEVESGCSPSARGPKGSVGLLQLQPATGRAMAEASRLPWEGVRTLTRPVTNIKLGLRYLSQLEQKLQDPLVALAAYNMGPARVARIGRKRARNARYVRRILSRYHDFLASSA